MSDPRINGASTSNLTNRRVLSKLQTVVTSLRKVADEVELIRAEGFYDRLPDQLDQVEDVLELLHEVTKVTSAGA